MYRRHLKRIVDVCISLTIIPLALVICVILCLIISLDSAGPVIFKQRRLGRDKREFTLYKLRTMQLHTGDHASHETSISNITRVGKFVRRTKLDELPQFFNILIGDMSLIGPRPCLPLQDTVILEREKHDVFSVRPGITGLAQISGVDMSDPAQLSHLDGQYVANINWKSDLSYLVQTFSGLGKDSIRD